MSDLNQEVILAHEEEPSHHYPVSEVKEGSFGIGRYIVNWAKSPIPFSTTLRDDEDPRRIYREVHLFSVNNVIMGDSKILRVIIYKIHMTFLKSPKRVWGNIKRARHYESEK